MYAASTTAVQAVRAERDRRLLGATRDVDRRRRRASGGTRPAPPPRTTTVPGDRDDVVRAA